MFKKISLFFVLVLVIGALSACAGSVPELSEEKKAEIEDTWYAQYEWTWYDNGGRCRYYGTYEGYDLIFHQMGDILLDVVGTKVIAGIEFYCGNSFNFYGHRDGKIYEVAELYESGALSKESIAAAAEIHNSEEKTLPLSDEEKRRFNGRGLLCTADYSGTPRKSRKTPLAITALIMAMILYTMFRKFLRTVKIIIPQLSQIIYLNLIALPSFLASGMVNMPSSTSYMRTEN